MVTVEQHSDDENLLVISFKYYKDYIRRIKEIGGQFDSMSKVWLLDKNKIDDLDTIFTGELFYKTPRWELLDLEPPDYSKMYAIKNKIDLSKLNFKLPPFKYQEYGMQFLIDRLKRFNMAFICDGMGVGM